MNLFQHLHQLILCLLLASHIISWCYEFNPTSSLTNASYKLSLLLFFCLKFMSNISIPWLHSYYFTIYVSLLLLLYVLRCFLSHGWWEFYLLGWAAPYILSIPTRCQLWLNWQKSNTATSDKEWSTNYHRNLESIIRPYYGITYRDNLCTIEMNQYEFSPQMVFQLNCVADLTVWISLCIGQRQRSWRGY